MDLRQRDCVERARDRLVTGILAHCAQESDHALIDEDRRAGIAARHTTGSSTCLGRR
jgi:hypothetical protein